MKQAIVLGLTLLAANSMPAADAPGADKVKDAISKLQSAANYSWTMTVKMPGSPFEPGPLKGQTEKLGFTTIKQEMGENTMEAVFKGTKIVLKQDGQWLLSSELDQFPAMMANMLVRNGAAADEADNMLKKAQELKAGDDGTVSSDYTEAGAKELLTFGPNPPKSAKGSIKYWLKDGALAKFESHLQGKIAFGPDGEENDFEMTRTFEIQDVGSTKVEPPVEAKAKLEPKPAESKPAEKPATP